jgi:hypothetical protein
VAEELGAARWRYLREAIEPGTVTGKLDAPTRPLSIDDAALLGADCPLWDDTTRRVAAIQREAVGEPQ